MIHRFSNTVIGFLNLFALLASVPIIGAGLWMASKNSTTCESFLQMPLLVVGFLILVISLIGFMGACFHLSWALWLYLLVMLLLILALIIFTIFGFVVSGTRVSAGADVSGRNYKEYELQDYSPWLRKKINDPNYWNSVRRCIIGSRICPQIATWSTLDYVQKTMSPLQSGCCKPPTSCSYGGTQADCFRWNSAPELLCYDCNSCKAGVLEQFRRNWQKISVLNVIVLVILIAVYSIGCCAFRNTRRVETGFPYGENRMSKIIPRWDYNWWRWISDRRNWLY